MKDQPGTLRGLLDHYYGGFDAVRRAIDELPESGHRRRLTALLMLVDELDRAANDEMCSACESAQGQTLLLQLELAVTRDVFSQLGRALQVLLECAEPATRERAVGEIDRSAAPELLDVFARAQDMSLDDLRTIIWTCAREPYLQAWLAEREAAAQEEPTRGLDSDDPDDGETLH